MTPPPPPTITLSSHPEITFHCIRLNTLPVCQYRKVLVLFILGVSFIKAFVISVSLNSGVDGEMVSLNPLLSVAGGRAGKHTSASSSPLLC